MTTLTSFEIQDFTQAVNVPNEESLWSRITSKLGILFGRWCEALGQGMVIEDEDGNYHFTGGMWWH